jgi:hypothetical protein
MGLVKKLVVGGMLIGALGASGCTTTNGSYRQAVATHQVRGGFVNGIVKGAFNDYYSRVEEQNRIDARNARAAKLRESPKIRFMEWYDSNDDGNCHVSEVRNEISGDVIDFSNKGLYVDLGIHTEDDKNIEYELIGPSGSSVGKVSGPGKVISLKGSRIENGWHEIRAIVDGKYVPPRKFKVTGAGL